MKFPKFVTFASVLAVSGYGHAATFHSLHGNRNASLSGVYTGETLCVDGSDLFSSEQLVGLDESARFDSKATGLLSLDLVALDDPLRGQNCKPLLDFGIQSFLNDGLPTGLQPTRVFTGTNDASRWPMSNGLFELSAFNTSDSFPSFFDDSSSKFDASIASDLTEERELFSSADYLLHFTIDADWTLDLRPQKEIPISIAALESTNSGLAPPACETSFFSSLYADDSSFFSFNSNDAKPRTAETSSNRTSDLWIQLPWMDAQVSGTYLGRGLIDTGLSVSTGVGLGLTPEAGWTQDLQLELPSPVLRAPSGVVESLDYRPIHSPDEEEHNEQELHALRSETGREVLQNAMQNEARWSETNDEKRLIHR